MSKVIKKISPDKCVLNVVLSIKDIYVLVVFFYVFFHGIIFEAKLGVGHFLFFYYVNNVTIKTSFYSKIILKFILIQCHLRLPILWMVSEQYRCTFLVVDE